MYEQISARTLIVRGGQEPSKAPLYYRPTQSDSSQWEFVWSTFSGSELTPITPNFDANLLINWCVNVIGHPACAKYASEFHIPCLKIVKGMRSVGPTSRAMAQEIEQFRAENEDRFGTVPYRNLPALFENGSHSFEIDGVTINSEGDFITFDQSVFSFETAAKIAARVLSSTFTERYDERYFIPFLSNLIEADSASAPSTTGGSDMSTNATAAPEAHMSGGQLELGELPATLPTLLSLLTDLEEVVGDVEELKGDFDELVAFSAIVRLTRAALKQRGVHPNKQSFITRWLREAEADLTRRREAARDEVLELHQAKIEEINAREAELKTAQNALQSERAEFEKWFAETAPQLEQADSLQGKLVEADVLRRVLEKVKLLMPGLDFGLFEQQARAEVKGGDSVQVAPPAPAAPTAAAKPAAPAPSPKAEEPKPAPQKAKPKWAPKRKGG